ncbi:MAG: hypothetical protein ACSW8J_00220 [bacterium]
MFGFFEEWRRVKCDIIIKAIPHSTAAVAVSQSETENSKGIFALSGGAFSAIHLMHFS